MRKWFVVLLWSTILLLSLPVNSSAEISSDELLEILKKKGVITDQDIEGVKESREEETLVKAYRKTKSFGIAGRVQFRYMHMENDSNHDLVTNQKAFDAPEFDGFVLRRVRVRVQGNVTDNWSYHVQASCDGQENADRIDPDDTDYDYEKDDTGFKLQDAEINYRLHPYLNIHMGQFKTRFSAAYLTRGPNLPLCERALIIDRIGPPTRDIGISIESEKGKYSFDGREHGMPIYNKPIYYAVGIYNGNGMNHMRNDNDNFMYTAMLLVRPCKHFNFGTSYAYNKEGHGSAAQDIDYWNVNAAIDIGRVHVQGEYISEDPDRGADASGYGIQGQVDILDNFQLTARYDELDPNDTVDNEKDSRWYTVGYNWFIHGQKVKWQLNYTFREEMHGEDVNNDVLITHLQLLF
ncbi:MAG: porin [Pseudomonadota bacterium]